MAVHFQTNQSTIRSGQPKISPKKVAPDGPGQYTVKKDDTLSQIALDKLGSASRWPEIAKLNNITDPRTIQPNTVLKLPEAKPQLTQEQVSTKTVDNKTDVAEVANNFAHTHTADTDGVAKKNGQLNLMKCIASHDPIIDPKKTDVSTMESYQAEKATENGGAQTAKASKGAVIDFVVGAADGAKETLKGLKDMGVGAWKMTGGALFNPKRAKETWAKVGQTAKFVASNPGTVAKALAEPYKKAWQEGRPGEALGRGTFEAVSLFFGPKGLDKLGKLARVSKAAKAVASTADEAAKAAEVARKVASFADDGVKAAAAGKEAGSKAAKAANTAQKAADIAKDGIQVSSKTKQLAKELANAKASDVLQKFVQTKTAKLAQKYADSLAGELAGAKVKYNKVGSSKGKIEKLAKKAAEAQQQADRIARQAKLHRLENRLAKARTNDVVRNTVEPKTVDLAIKYAKQLQDELSMVTAESAKHIGTAAQRASKLQLDDLTTRLARAKKEASRLAQSRSDNLAEALAQARKSGQPQKAIDNLQHGLNRALATASVYSGRQLDEQD